MSTYDWLDMRLKAAQESDKAAHSAQHLIFCVLPKQIVVKGWSFSIDTVPAQYQQVATGGNKVKVLSFVS